MEKFQRFLFGFQDVYWGDRELYLLVITKGFTKALEVSMSFRKLGCKFHGILVNFRGSRDDSEKNNFKGEGLTGQLQEVSKSSRSFQESFRMNKFCGVNKRSFRGLNGVLRQA